MLNPEINKTIAALLSAIILSPGAVNAYTDDTALLDELEGLLATEVVGASKSRQLIREAPANVTIIYAEDIVRYGYHTLSDALASIPGVLISVGPQIDSFSNRGSSGDREEDFNSGILLMVDGHRMNDGLYDQASLGYDSFVDMESVERIEFIKGPGAAMYGGNALAGVVNVITKSGKNVKGVNLWTRYIDDKLSSGMLLGGETGHDLQWLISASTMALPTSNTRLDDILAIDLDGNRHGSFYEEDAASKQNKQIMAKLQGRNYALLAGYSSYDAALDLYQKPDFVSFGYREADRGGK